MESRNGSAIFVLGVAIICSMIAYVVHPPAPLYDVVNGTWAMSLPEGSVAIGWYGRMMWLLGAGGAGAILAGVLLFSVPGLRRSLESRGVIAIEAAIVSLVFVLAAVVVIHHEWVKWIVPSQN